MKGSKPDGLDEAYLLFNFDPATKVPDMIIGPKHWLGQLEADGVDVLFIVDTCYGGGMTRAWDPRSGEMTYRDPRLKRNAQSTESVQRPELHQPGEFTLRRHVRTIVSGGDLPQRASRRYPNQEPWTIWNVGSHTSFQSEAAMLGL